MSHCLKIPEITEIQLLNRDSIPLLLPGLVVFVKAKARRKNDYSLGPFWSDEEGKILIKKDDVLKEIDATHDSGLMDYAGISQCEPMVKVVILNKDEVERIANFRRIAWTSLLRGERERFKNMDELIMVYETSPNRRFQLADSERTKELIWDGSSPSCISKMKVNIEREKSRIYRRK